MAYKIRHWWYTSITQRNISFVFFSGALDKIKLESQNGKEKFTLSQVAQIKLNNSMFVVDLSSSPEVGKIIIVS